MTQPSYIIDFDNTIVRCESLEELARLALHDHEDQEAAMRRLSDITNQSMAGMLPFDDSLRQRLRLFTANQSHLDQLINFLKQNFTPSVRRHRDWIMQNAEHIYVLSGGFEEFIVPVVAELGIAADHVLANRFQVDSNGGITGHDEQRPLGQAGGKVLQIAELKLPRPVIVIGDGFTDYEIRAAGEADEFWAFCENVSRPSVTSHADRVLESFDGVVELAYAVQ